MSCGCTSSIDCASHIQAGVVGFPIYATFLDLSCKPLLIDGATVEVIIRRPAGLSSTTIVRPAAPWPAYGSTNTAQYIIQPGDFAVPGVYRVQFRISYADGRVAYTPVKVVNVHPNLV